MRVDGVVLAAGSAERFGAPKLLAPWRGEALIRHVVRSALSSRLECVHVVVAPASGVTDALRDLDAPRLRVVEHPGAAAGMSSSLQRGLRNVEADRDGAMILLGDMPWLGSDAIDRLLGAWRGGVLVPVCEGVERHPRLIPRELFARFLALGAAQRPAAALQGVAIRRMEFEDAGIFRDVDRPSDLED